MGSLQVQVKPENKGNVTVQVQLAQTPGGTPLNETFEASTDKPFDKTWELDPALYAVTIQWREGFHNISGAAPDNAIIVNGKPLYYQVSGEPLAQRSVSAMFGVQL